MDCSFKGCTKKAFARGLCGAHYQQWRNNKELKPLQLQFHGLSERERFEKWIGKLPNGCWRWLGSIKSRNNRPQKEWHGQFRNQAGEIELAHRAAWRLFVGPIPPRALVLHKCDVPRCCNPEHLYLGTQADNVHDMHERHRGVKRGLVGENHNLAVLTDALVREIRASSELEHKIAKRLGISRTTVNDVRRRRTWKHI